MSDYVWGVNPSADWGQSLSPVQDSYDYNPVSDDDYYTWDSNYWDSGWDNAFADTSFAGVSSDLDNMMASNDDLYAFGGTEKPWYDRILDSPSAMSTIGALGLGAANLIQKNSEAGDIRAENEKNRRWKEKQAELDRKHAEHLLEMRLASQEGSSGYHGPEEPPPGKADDTTTALASNPVNWRKR